MQAAPVGQVSGDEPQAADCRQDGLREMAQGAVRQRPAQDQGQPGQPQNRDPELTMPPEACDQGQGGNRDHEDRGQEVQALIGVVMNAEDGQQGQQDGKEGAVDQAQP